ncbi:hypothetical protein BVRB_8g198310 [Beta vulgaris subsp. vulgaris]|nr:hypothetical protein BVRB_8g198310 [Beta vulgaris subsp. vulgaris]
MKIAAKSTEKAKKNDGARRRSAGNQRGAGSPARSRVRRFFVVERRQRKI